MYQLTKQKEKMMKRQFVVTSLSAISLLGSVAMASAQTSESRSVSASVAGALQAPTGFLIGGQVQVTGVGQGSVLLTRGLANISLEAGAFADVNNAGIVPASESRMVTTFDFSREIETAGALTGIGNVVAQGESLGGVGIVGAASANATRSGTDDSGASPASGSATTPTTAQGSLIGDFTTTNNMQLVGTGALFAGAQTLSIGERTQGISFGGTGLITADAASIDLDSARAVMYGESNGASSTADGPEVYTDSGIGGGAGFRQASTLLGGGNNTTIDFNVANAGAGTVAVSASTGGFFGEGTAFSATALPTFSQINGFFDGDS